MRKLFLFILFILITHSACAATVSKAPEDVYVKFDFNYKTAGGVNINELSSEHNIQNTIKMSTNNPQWVVSGLTHGRIESSDGSPSFPSSNYNIFVLLAKTSQADADKVTINFLVLDLNAQSEFIGESKIIASYGKKEEANIIGNRRKIRLKVLAEKSQSLPIHPG